MSQVIEIEQSLYGYAEGHRLLAGSITANFSHKTQQQLLRLSDASATELSKNQSVCLTGFPLAELKKYALIKTWNAPEVSRSGCVWSHVLFINFFDMGRIADLSNLLSFFQYPNVKDFSCYKQSLKVCPNEKINTIENVLNLGEISDISSRLYSFPDSEIKVTVRDSTIDSIFGVWSQQWPSLRRNFRFRTQSNSLKERFDIVSLTNFLDKDENNKEGEPWVKLVVDDVEASVQSDFRRFIWRLGAACKDNRRSFLNLVKLYCAKEYGLNDVFMALSEWSDCPDVVKDTVIIEALNNSKGSLNFQSFSQLMNYHESLISPQISSILPKLIHSFNDEEILESLRAWSFYSEELFPLVLPLLSVDSLIKIIKSAPEYTQKVVHIRHEVFLSPLFWKDRMVIEDPLLDLLSNGSGFKSEVIEVALKNGPPDMAGLLMTAGNRDIAIAIIECSIREFDYRDVDYWISTVSNFQDILKDAVYSLQRPKLGILELFSRHMDYRVAASIGESDLWASKIDEQIPTINRELMFFIFKRSLAIKDEYLASVTFETVYRWVKSDSLSNDEWLDLCEVLPAKPINPLFTLWDTFSIFSVESKIDRLCRIVAGRFFEPNPELDDMDVLTKDRYILIDLKLGRSRAG